MTTPYASSFRCVRCGQMSYRNSAPSGAGLLVVANRLLLLRRSRQPARGLWDLPGGFCEYGEDPAEATLREFREESGLEVALTGLVGIYMDWYAGRNEPPPGRSTLNVVYCVTATDGSVASGDGRPKLVESGEGRLGWFDPTMLPPLAFPASTGRAIVDGLVLHHGGRREDVERSTTWQRSTC